MQILKSFAMNIFIHLLLVILIASCATTNESFNSKPYSIATDKITGAKIIQSRRLLYMLHNEEGYNSPYINIFKLNHKGETAWKLFVRVFATEASHFSSISFKCGNKSPMTHKRRVREKWHKNFDSTCSAYGCSYEETARIVIEKNLARYILSCDDELYVRVSGKHLFDHTYMANKSPIFFQVRASGTGLYTSR